MDTWLKSFGVMLSVCVLMLAQGGASSVIAHSSSEHSSTESMGESMEIASSAYPIDRVIQMLDTHLRQLEGNLEMINQRIQKLREFPATDDPIIRELRALDLEAWELHREQWRLQQEYLAFAHQQLQRVKDDPGLKSDIVNEWKARQEAYTTALNDYRQKRHDLETRRIQVEARLIERYLQ